MIVIPHNEGAKLRYYFLFAKYFIDKFYYRGNG
jgi:hypothetical protein